MFKKPPKTTRSARFVFRVDYHTLTSHMLRVNVGEWVCEEKQYEIWIYRKQHKRKSEYMCEADDDAGVPFMYVIFSHLYGTAGMNIDSRIREFRTFVTDQCHL